MKNSLSPKIESELLDLCRRISETHHLDENAQKKLYNRMEKLFTEYFQGKEKITEENAFILVREHFGKPEYVQSLLAEVHEMETHTSLARRIGAVLAATIGVGVLINVVVYMIHFPLNFIFGIRIEQPWLPGYLYVMLNPIILYIVLKRWRNTEERGDNLWFQQVPLVKMALIIGILFAADTVIPMAYYAAHYYLLHPPPFSDIILNGVSILVQNHPDVGALIHFLSGRINDILFNWVALGSSLAQCAVWLWWCDSSSRRLSARAAAVGAWVAFVFLTAVYQPLLGIGSNEARQVILYISWHRDNVGRFPSYTITTVLLGVCVLMIYIIVGRILDRRKKDQAVVIQQ